MHLLLLCTGKSTFQYFHKTQRRTCICTTFKVWPIPNNGFFSVLMNNDGTEAELKIFDILDKEVLKQNIKGKTKENINLKSKGVYILKISSPESKKKHYMSKKIIVQ